MKSAGDASGETLRKNARPEDLPVPTPSRTATPPPPPPHTKSSTEQAGGSLVAELLSNASCSTIDKVQYVARHHHNQEAFASLPSMRLDQVLAPGFNEVVSGLLTVNNGWHHVEKIDSKHAEEIKAWESNARALEAKVKTTEDRIKIVEDKIKAVEDKVKEFEDKAAVLTEEFKNNKEDLAKAVATKEKFKESSETN
ncbi:uncharacterized protein LOC133816312 [Humulus lupulus]|uniref:uncharacterized protein LOC133816312 n=1 Tax=Humulus lupulus TaxID=3486 RepID=UPI002B414437|nr:uncharacterized protein LOC133816312 [Humulus lupulus]